MSNYPKTPKRETLLRCEALMTKRTQELRVEQPELSEDAIAEMLLAMPEIAALMEQVTEEIVKRRIMDEIDAWCFTYTNKDTGKRLCMPDEDLLRMPDRELAAWAQKAGVMFAQLKAHIAERFPKPEGKA